MAQVTARLSFEKEGCVLITIADNGPGIERGASSRIFDPFFTTKPNGTGLGLPMVKRAVSAHGGVVSIST